MNPLDIAARIRHCVLVIDETAGFMEECADHEEVLIHARELRNVADIMRGWFEGLENEAAAESPGIKDS